MLLLVQGRPTYGTKGAAQLATDVIHVYNKDVSMLNGVTSSNVGLVWVWLLLVCG